VIRGMTGFAEKSFGTKSLRLKIGIRTLNHRFFDWTLKGTPLGEAEAGLRSICQRHIRRGRVEVHVEAVSLHPGSWEFAVNEGLLEKIFSSLDLVSRKTGRRLEFPPESLFRIPQLVELARKRLSPAETVFLERSFEKTLAGVDRLRRIEGRDTARALRGHIRKIRASVHRIEKCFRAQPALIRDKLRIRVRDLNQGTSFTEERLAEEAAYLAQRYDLAEEIARLKAHLRTFEGLLSPRVSDPVGKRMDFLAQELHREANTLNSKSQDLRITEESLAVKNEVESIRQHVQNIE
jgi:uncharacterized protein (TIGR00255 family)